uniref:MIF4G domain-containing protein n=1 Tax=Eptatretus burgeri TaxID=7764 RepID=A0A8C4WUX9_EPTBU
MTDLKNRNDCLDAVVLKNNQISQEMHQMCIKVQNLEQQHQEPQQKPCSQQKPSSPQNQEPQQKACSQQKPSSQQNQEPQQKPCSQQKPSSQQNQEPQQKPCSQPPLEQEKSQEEQMDQNNSQHHQPQRNKEARVIHHVIECGEPIKSTSTAWRPTKKRGMASDDEDIIRQFRSLLNKLTPENFDRIIHQMKSINITKEGHLKDIVQLVLSKAMMESKFSEVYAIMCSHLSKIEVQQTSKPGNILNFRILLIQGCHNEFKMGMDGSSSLDDAASKEKARQRALGNVIFIGELFKAEVLHESVISDIVRGLLKDGKEQSLEYLCRLLGVAGKILDSTQRAMMNEHFTSLNRLVKGRKMSSRMRFMLQDLIDLRMRKWIPRRKVERPMYLQEIRAEACEQQQRRSHYM